ncbi:deoxynucleotide monophosphate kinase family protein [Streptomyces atratus]|uniref:deoxynucleotide monophosphate kinase family protein n=1 Tax=Streptomyces atratus TaxID=1893 RepID=UPI00365E292E
MLPHIALHGLAGVGKDTIGRYLEVQHGHIKVAVSDILREYLVEANPLVIRDRDARAVPLSTLLAEADGSWDTIKRENPDVRETLKKFGHGARLIFGDDCWAHHFLATYKSFVHEYFGGIRPPTCITDIRYENELAMLNEYFDSLLTIKVIRPGHTPDGHPSEDGLPDEMFDAVIENNGSLADLYASVSRTLAIHNIAEAEAA